MKTKVEIIKEAISRPRAVDENGDCLYFDTETKRKCAVGHCLNDPEGVSKLEAGSSDVESLIGELGFEIFKKDYRQENHCFWDDLQGLHDRSRYWEGGNRPEALKGVQALTIEGQEECEKLIEKYA